MTPALTEPSGVDDIFHFYSHLRTQVDNTAILESLGPYDESTSRFSLVGAIPIQVLVTERHRAWLVDCDGGDRTEVDWLAVLDEWCPVGRTSSEDPVQTGAIGYIGYDANPAGEARSRRLPPDTEVPDIRLVRYGAILAFDRAAASSTWAYDPEFEHEIRRLEHCWDAWRAAPRPEEAFEVHGDILPDVAPEAVSRSVARTIEFIRAGDIFQANITARYSVGCKGDLFETYSRLRQSTPNPFFAFLDTFPPLLSTSPERFFRVAGRRIESRPIKGTAPRQIGGVDQRPSLLASAKDRAENVMIVDVVRNDLGRVCSRGSVHVDSLCEAKAFNHLYHLESTVSGVLAAGATTTGILGALFPAASITGAPKLRAMEVIDELEYQPRGPYCGAIGFFGNAGLIDTSVAIRIVYANQSRAYLHAGGGIVVDSDPIAEGAELRLKLAALLEPLDSFNVLAARRRAIDAVDTRLIAALADRFALVSEVAEIKSKYGIASLQPLRVASMRAARERQAHETGSIPPGLVTELFDLLVRYAMKAEDARRRETEGP